MSPDVKFLEASKHQSSDATASNGKNVISKSVLRAPKGSSENAMIMAYFPLLSMMYEDYTTETTLI